MTSHRLLGVFLAAIVFQAGCGSESAEVPPAADPAGPAPVAASPRAASPRAANPSAANPSAANPSVEPKSTAESTTSGGGGSSTVVLPEGTVLTIRTTSALSSKTQEAGQKFSASLEQPLLQDGRSLAPKGARVEGKIVDADDGGRVKGLASLTVELTGLQVGSHFIYISTNTVTQSAGTTKRDDAVKVGIGAGVGAAIGAIAGGGKGAAIGAAAGGAAGTGVVLATRGDPAVIPSESLLTFALRAPVTLTIAPR